MTTGLLALTSSSKAQEVRHAPTLTPLTRAAHILVTMRRRPLSLATHLRSVPRSVLREWLVLAAILCTVSGVLSTLEALSPLDALWYDAIVARLSLPVPADVALITIAPATLHR